MEQVPKTCLDPSDVEPALVFAARQMDTFNLDQQWQQMRYQADQEAALEAEEERRRQRWLSLRQIPTGNYRIEGVLDAEGGATLKTVIKGILGRHPAQDDERTPAPPPSSSGPGAGWTRATCPSGAARSRISC